MESLQQEPGQSNETLEQINRFINMFAIFPASFISISNQY